MLKLRNLALSHRSSSTRAFPFFLSCAESFFLFRRPRCLPSSSRFHVKPRVRVESGCTEAIYFWHPFLLRLVHPFIICMCFCCPVPVGSVFVGPLEAHVSIFLVATTPLPPPSPSRRRTRLTQVYPTTGGGKRKFATQSNLI